MFRIRNCFTLFRIQHIVSNQNYKNVIFPSEVVPLQSSALSHPSLSRLSALLEGVFWSLPQYGGIAIYESPVKRRGTLLLIYLLVKI